jgi:hypothetical protein
MERDDATLYRTRLIALAFPTPQSAIRTPKSAIRTPKSAISGRKLASSVESMKEQNQ